MGVYCFVSIDVDYPLAAIAAFSPTGVTAACNNLLMKDWYISPESATLVAAHILGIGLRFRSPQRANHRLVRICPVWYMSTKIVGSK